MAGDNLWEEVLIRVRGSIEPEDFRRWFGATAYASDSGDQITVWVPSEAIRRHILTHYKERLQRALTSLDRPDTTIRLVVAGYGEDEDDEE